MESIANRLPPQNTDAEASVLGALMLDKNAMISVADILRKDDFYQNKHNNIYEAMIDLYSRGEPIDLLSLSNRLKERKKLKEIGGSAYLTELINSVPTSAHVVHYANIVRNKSVLRRLISASAEITELAFKEEQEIESLLDQAEKKIFNISNQSNQKNFVALKPMLSEAFERLDALSKGDGRLRGLATGFIDIDNKLAGLQNSDLLILAARPSLGKSSLALDIARHVAVEEKKPVGIFSLEMSKDQLVDRLLCSQGNVELWKFRTGRLSNQGQDSDFMRVNQAIDSLSKAPIYIDDSSASGIMQIRTMARRLQAEQGLGLLIIDYLQLMEGSTRTENRVQEISEISRSLKTLARELNIPILAISQLSRAVEQRTPAVPRLSDLRESGCLSGDTIIARADTGEEVSIKNLVGQKNIPIFSLGTDNKLKIKKISKVFSSGRKKIFELKTKSGRTIKASSNHKFYTIKGWQRLDQIKAGTHIALPRTTEIKAKSPSPISNKELILLAHLIGDGCILPKQPYHYTSADKNNINIVAKTSRDLFKINARIIKQKNWYHTYLPSPSRLARGKYHPITNWFKKLGIKPARSYKKVLPNSIFQIKQSQIKLFLHHLWATDGNISFKKIKNRKLSGNIYYSTTSQVLAKQIQKLLLRLGIMSTLREISQTPHNTNHQVHIQGKPMQLRFCKLVGAYGKKGKIIPKLIKALEKIQTNTNLDIIPKEIWKSEINSARIDAGMSWRDFCKKMNMSYCGNTLFKHGLSRDRALRVAKIIQSKKLSSLAQSDIYWDETKSIRLVGQEEVFDATVPKTHNFLANNIIVHNSLEQDADVVMFIYREDREKRNSERKNIAEIIIAKHRNGPIGQVPLYFNENYVSFKNLEKSYGANTTINQGIPTPSGNRPETGGENGFMGFEESEPSIPTNPTSEKN